MSLTLSLQDYIGNQMRNDAEIMAIAKSVSLLNDESNYPFITLGYTAQSESKSLSVNYLNYRVQIDAWSDKQGDNADVLKLLDLIKNKFGNQKTNIPLSGGCLVDRQLINSQMLHDPIGWHGVIEFNFKIMKG